MPLHTPYRPFETRDREHSWVDTATLVEAIVNDFPVTCMYRDSDGVVSYRTVVPRAIERCKNGSTIVRVHDCQRKAARSFTLVNITNVLPL